MSKNMGSVDRVLRIIVAVVLVYLAANGTLAGGLAIGAYIVAAVFVLTSVVSFCPAYRLLGMNTCSKG